MKKNIFILSFIMLFISILFSLPILDNLSGVRAYSHLPAYDDTGLDRIGVAIENTEKTLDVSNEEFYSSMNSIAIKNNLAIYVLTTNYSDGQPESVIYVSSNEPLLQSRLLLEKGYAVELSEGVTYSTYSNNREHKILSFMPIVPLSVRPISQLDERGNFMNIICLEGDIKENVRNFMNDLTDKFGMLILQSPYYPANDTRAHVDLEAIQNVTSQAGIKSAIALVLVVLLCLKIFSCTKKISIMKMEGHSTLNIYLKLFLLDYIKYISILIILFIICTTLIYGTNYMTLLAIISITLLQLLQFFGYSFLISILIYLIILYTPVTISIKGQNKLKEVQLLAYFIKFLAAFFIIPIFCTTLIDVKNLFIITYRHDKVFDSLEYYYTFGTQRSSSEYSDEIGKENYIKLRDELAIHNKLFSQSKIFLTNTMSAFSSKSESDGYLVNQNYLKNESLLDEDCNLKQICIYIRNSSSVDRTDLVNKVSLMTREPIEINIIEFEQTLKSFSFDDLLYYDNLENLPIIYLPPEEGLDGQLNNSIFYFEGSVQLAQSYIDDLFIKYGYNPFFQINSLQSSYQRLYQVYSTNYLKSFIEFMIMLLAYIFANRLLIEVDIDNNHKRYKLASVEGISPYNLPQYLLKIVAPSVLAIGINLYVGKMAMDSFFFVTMIFISVIEIILYLLFYYKYSNIRRN